MIHLDHYGLHWLDGGIALLVQQNKVDHVMGIHMEFPVEVKRHRQGQTCPHDIRLEDAEFGELPDNELVRAMLPVPKAFGDPVIFVEQTPANSQYVNQLLRLSTSKHMVPLWSAREELLGPQLQVTNLAPLVIFGYDVHRQILFNKVIEMGYYSPRQLILLAPKYTVLRPEVKRVEITPTDLSSLPLEKIGAWHLKERMLGHADEPR